MATNSEQAPRSAEQHPDTDGGRTQGHAGGRQMGTTAARHPAPARHQVGRWALWFGLFGAPAAWSAQTVVNYVAASHTCYPNLYPLATPTIGHTGLTAVVVAVSILALIVALAAGVVSLASWRETRDETGGQSHWALDTGEGRTRFMAMSGILLSVMFLITIIVHGAAAALTTPCW